MSDALRTLIDAALSGFGVPGAAVALPLAGRRALAVEVQALVGSPDGPARRQTTGLDGRRFQLMAAVHIEAAKMGLSAVGHATGLDQELDRMSLGRACLSYAHLLASLVVLVYFMMVENRTAAAALYAAATIIAGELLKGSQ